MFSRVPLWSNFQFGYYLAVHLCIIFYGVANTDCHHLSYVWRVFNFCKVLMSLLLSLGNDDQNNSTYWALLPFVAVVNIGKYQHFLAVFQELLTLSSSEDSLCFISVIRSPFYVTFLSPFFACNMIGGYYDGLCF